MNLFEQIFSGCAVVSFLCSAAVAAYAWIVARISRPSCEPGCPMCELEATPASREVDA